MKKKYFLGLILLIAIIIFMKSLYSPNAFAKPDVLNGTYNCDELNFSSISFDEKDQLYYYYNHLEKEKSNTDLVSKGSYKMVDKGIYIIESTNIIREQEIICSDNTFTILINDAKYNFYKIDDNPIININDSQDD